MLPMLRCFAKPIVCNCLEKLIEALSIRTRPATCSAPAVRLCLKQFYKDHYFLSRDVLQLNKILLRSLPHFALLAAAALMVQLKMN